MALAVRGIETAYVNTIRGGGGDANGQVVTSRVAREAANPCRHCLGLIAEGEQKLVLAYQPFSRLQPYLTWMDRSRAAAI